MYGGMASCAPVGNRRLSSRWVVIAGMAFLPLLAHAAIWPEMIGPFQRTATSTPKLFDPPLWDEYGLKESEVAGYRNGAARFTAIGYRLQDTTAALAAFDWQRPAAAKPSKLADLAAETKQNVILVHGNYLLLFQGYKPSPEEVAPLFDSLRNVDTTPLPTLPGFFPSQGLVPNSERYILGPTSLARFDPGIPPSVAGFHLGTEAQLGVFHSPKGNLVLGLFNYPTPQIAMQQLADFQKLPGAVVKRSGPLIAAILSPTDPDAAERLLAQVRYEAQITLDEHVPTAADNPGTMLINIFILTGILIGFCIIAGLFVGGFRTLLLGRRKGIDAEPMILLHLEQR
jgi:hypothetical protein